MDGAGHDRNTEREGKVGLVRMGTGSTGHAGEVEVEAEVASVTAIAVRVPAPRMEVPEEEVGLRRPSEVVRDHSQFGWSRQSVSIDRLK